MEKKLMPIYIDVLVPAKELSDTVFDLCTSGKYDVRLHFADAGLWSKYVLKDEDIMKGFRTKGTVPHYGSDAHQLEESLRRRGLVFDTHYEERTFDAFYHFNIDSIKQ